MFRLSDNADTSAIDPKIKHKVYIEHTHILMDLYHRAYLGALPFGILLCTLFWGHIEATNLLTWLAVFSFGVLSQLALAIQFNKTKLSNVIDYQRWARYAIIGTFLIGMMHAYLSILSTRLPSLLFFMVQFFLILSVTISTAIGSQKIFWA